MSFEYLRGACPAHCPYLCTHLCPCPTQPYPYFTPDLWPQVPWLWALARLLQMRTGLVWCGCQLWGGPRTGPDGAERGHRWATHSPCRPKTVPRVANTLAVQCKVMCGSNVVSRAEPIWAPSASRGSSNDDRRGCKPGAEGRQQGGSPKLLLLWGPFA